MKSALNNLLIRLMYGEHLYATPNRPRRAFCDTLFHVFGHHACCRVPEWTARFGQRWDTWDRAPWNLYNVTWALKTWVRQGMTP